MNTTITDRLLYNLTSYQYCVSALQYCGIVDLNVGRNMLQAATWAVEFREGLRWNQVSLA